MDKDLKITILGEGKFGKAMYAVLERHKPATVDIELEGPIKGQYTEENKDKIRGADLLVFCVPSQYLESCCKMLGPLVNENMTFVSCVKGLIIDEGIISPSEVISKYFDNPKSVLAGPNIAREIYELQRPTFAALAGGKAEEIAHLFKTDFFGIKVQEDALGVEIGGVLKNPIALGYGLIEGYFGKNEATNTLGTFVANALEDMQAFYKRFSEQKVRRTRHLPHLSFLGDLITTCASDSSRNYRFGHALGLQLKREKEEPGYQRNTQEILDEIGEAVEGYPTLEALHQYSEKNKVSIPIISALYNVVYNNASIDDLFKSWQ